MYELSFNSLTFISLTVKNRTCDKTASIDSINAIQKQHFMRFTNYGC